jgi:hypothetical protein
MRYSRLPASAVSLSAAKRTQHIGELGLPKRPDRPRSIQRKLARIGGDEAALTADIFALATRAGSNLSLTLGSP